MAGIGVRARAAAALAAAALLSGCVGGNTPTYDLSVPIGYCPEVIVVPGSEFVTVYDRGGEGNPDRVRYQASITSTARECRAEGGVVRVVIGISGRFTAGPRSPGGTATEPVRISVLIDGQTAFTKTYSASANIGAPSYGGPFYIVEEGIAFPTPSVDRAVEIEVGFD